MRLLVPALAASIPAALFTCAPAAAQPGLGEKVYGATLEPGTTEIEARYGRLTGGKADGEDALIFELAHHFSKRFYGAVLFETEREPGSGRKLEAVGFEGIATLGRIEPLGVDVALYGEYEAVRNGPDAVEAKLLLQHKRGGFDGRLNLIAERPVHESDVEFGYAASADWHVAGEFQAGITAFGEFTEAEHFVGPVLKTEIEHLPGAGELGIEAGYLFALGDARHETDGQARLLLEYEFRF